MSSAPDSFLLLESGDGLLLESGDGLLLDKSFSSAHASRWDIRQALDSGQTVDVPLGCVSAHAVALPLPCLSPHASSLGLLCVSAHTVYSRGVLSSAHTTRLPWGLQRGHTTAWDLRQAIQSAHVTACRLAEQMSSAHRARWDIAWSDGILTSAHANYWDLGSWAPVATPAPVICTVGGVVVDVASLSIGQENGAQWSADINLADPADLDRFAIDALFTLQVGGQTWSLWVDRRTLARSGGDVQGGAATDAGIFALGSPVGLDHPRAAPITKTWAVPIMASAAVAELLGSVDWAMVDWSIPPDRLAVVDASPLAAARSVVQAAGGVLEMSPDGSIRARPEYPITLPDWAGATPDHIITEIDSIFGLDEQLAVEQLVDSVRVYDADAAELGSGGDRLEFQADEADGLWGTVTAYPSPWRELTLRTSAGGRVAVLGRGASAREVVETVEFSDGAGSVGYPMAGLSSVTWITASLGGVSWTPQGSQVKAEIAGYSLASVAYITSYYYWRVFANQSTPAQFILEDADDSGSPAGIIDVTCVRGDGTHPGPDVLDSLLGSEAAAVARGRRELDAGALHSLVALTCPFLPAVRAGHLVEIAESRNATWRGMVSGVRHERSGPLPSTTLQIIRAL